MKPNFSEILIINFSRLLAFVGAMFFLVLFFTSLLGYFFYKSKENTVNLKEIYSLLNKEKKSNSTITLNQLRLEPVLPEKVEQYMKGENKEILYEWMIGMEIEERRDFLGNMALIIEEAEKNNLDLTMVINEYKNLKLNKMKKTSFEKILEKDVKLFFSFILILSAAFIILFGSVLSILSLEHRLKN